MSKHVHSQFNTVRQQEGVALLLRGVALVSVWVCVQMPHRNALFSPVDKQEESNVLNVLMTHFYLFKHTHRWRCCPASHGCPGHARVPVSDQGVVCGVQL